MDIFRINGNARRYTVSWLLLKLMLGLSYKVEDNGLLKDIWRCFECKCEHGYVLFYL